VAVQDRTLPRILGHVREESGAKQSARSPLRIAHILPWPTIGGTELATLRIAQAVGGGEFEHVAFCLKGANRLQELFSSAGFPTAAYDAVQPSYRRPGPYLAASLRLARDLRSLDIDLVHCSEVLAGHFTALGGKLARLPVICHVRSRHERVSRRDRTFLYPVDMFVFVSRDAWKHFGIRVPSRRARVVYDGLDVPIPQSNGGTGSDIRLEVRAEFGMPPSARIVAMAGHVAPQKDFRTLARAATRVVAEDDDVRFLIIGEHSQTARQREHYTEVRQILADLGLSGSFVFSGYRTDLPRLLQAVDMFVLSTHMEGLPLVLLEAMASGRPVIATAVGGIPELICSGETGLLFEHENADQLAHMILAVLRDSAYAARLGEAGRRHVQQQFTRERFAQSMATVYREAAGTAETLSQMVLQGT
jgi:glycosyltransferase involved in cell wall biosynthesis